jgi:serine protease Do
MYGTRIAAFSLLLLGSSPGWAGDVVQLHDDASVTGRILAEKKDSLIVDVGYTVLSIPRSAVVRTIREGTEEKAPSKASPPEKQAPVSAPLTSVVPASLPAAESKSVYSTAKGGTADRSVRDLVAQLGQGVVQVRTPSGLGSGFFVSEDGYLITNFHVIEGETKISVEVYHQKDGQLDRHSYKEVRIVAMNKFGDLALLKVDDKDAPKFLRVSLGESDALSVGDKVFAIGSPLGLERTVTEGILSTKTRQFQGALYLQTTTQINPGNSGGPLFNLRGDVVGVTNMKLNFSEGLAFAIPVEQVRWFLDHRDAFAYDNDNPSNPFRYLEPPRHLKLAASEEP